MADNSDIKRVLESLNKYSFDYEGLRQAAMEGSVEEPVQEVVVDEANMEQAIQALVDEASKPDFLDVDKDGNKKEPMKKALKDKDKVKEETSLTEGTDIGYIGNTQITQFGKGPGEVSVQITPINSQRYVVLDKKQAIEMSELLGKWGKMDGIARPGEFDESITEEPTGAQAAQQNLAKKADLKGQFNAKTFGQVLGMDSTESSLLQTFMNKRKQGQSPSRNELLVAADVFRMLVDADPQLTQKALMMLRRISDETPKESINMESNKMIDAEVEKLAESIRTTKEGASEVQEGLDDAWNGMVPGIGGMDAEPEAQMSININMPGKNISVTTDSADEILNVLKLAGLTASKDMDDAEAPAEEPAEEPAPCGMDMEVPAVDADQPEVDADQEVELHQEDVNGECGCDCGQSPCVACGKDHHDVDESSCGSKKKHKHESIEEAEEAEEAELDEEVDLEEEAEDARMEAIRILKNAGLALDEARWANAPSEDITAHGEPEMMELPSKKGTSGGNVNNSGRASDMGENPMVEDTVEESDAFETALGEYRKFVSENISKKK